MLTATARMVFDISWVVDEADFAAIFELCTGVVFIFCSGFASTALDPAGSPEFHVDDTIK